MKIAIIIGHYKKSKGAFSPYLQLSEWDFYNEVSKNLNNVTIFHHDPNIKGYTSRIKATAKKLNDFDIVIECHFNAATPKANGCETLYYFNSRKGKQYATIFSEIVNEATGIKLRNNGLKALVNENDRGFQSVYRPKPPTILIEPFFGSNREDCDKIESPEKMACILNTFLEMI